MKVPIVSLSVVILLVVMYLAWYFYERPYPKWWDSVKCGESGVKYLAEIKNDEANGINWDGKFHTIGYLYYQRSQWIRTEYAARATLNKMNPDIIENWEIVKMQYDSLYIFRKLWGEISCYVTKAAFGSRYFLLEY